MTNDAIHTVCKKECDETFGSNLADIKGSGKKVNKVKNMGNKSNVRK